MLRGNIHFDYCILDYKRSLGILIEGKSNSLLDIFHNIYYLNCFQWMFGIHLNNLKMLCHCYLQQIYIHTLISLYKFSKTYGI